MSNYDALMPEILSVMKGLASMLEKQDATQERAKLDKPPKTGDDQKPIAGGTAPGFKPGEGIAKEFPTLPKRVGGGNESTEIDQAGAGTLLKEDEETEEFGQPSEDEPSEEPTEEPVEDEASEMEEMKSILKSIAYELKSIGKSKAFSKADMQKAVHSEADKMLRKMGFNPSKPDVVKLTMGVDTLADVKKNEDREVETDIKKSEVNDLAGKDLTPLSWRELGDLRYQMGGFNPFAQK